MRQFLASQLALSLVALHRHGSCTTRVGQRDRATALAASKVVPYLPLPTQMMCVLCPLMGCKLPLLSGATSIIV